MFVYLLAARKHWTMALSKGVELLPACGILTKRITSVLRPRR